MPHLNQLFLWFNSFEVIFNLKSSEFRNILELGLNYNGSTQRKINFMVIIQVDNLYFSSEMKRILVRSGQHEFESRELIWTDIQSHCLFAMILARAFNRQALSWPRFNTDEKPYRCETGTWSLDPIYIGIPKRKPINWRLVFY